MLMFFDTEVHIQAILVLAQKDGSPDSLAGRLSHGI